MIVIYFLIYLIKQVNQLEIENQKLMLKLKKHKALAVAYGGHKEFEELKDFQKTAFVKVHLAADLNRKVDQKDTRMRDHYEFLILLEM